MQSYLFYTIIHLSLLNLIGCSYNDVIFPGRFDEEFKTNKGHLKPFGWQREPESKIMEYKKILPAETFYKRHMKEKLPLIYRNAISKSPAITLWDDEYLNSTYGELDVLVELKKENRDFTTGRMRFEKFLRYYKEKQIYIVSLLPTEMMKDVQAINSVLCGTFKNYTHESNFWMSNGGTRSVIHYDADENFHCVISGRKDFLLVDNKYEHLLYMDEKDEVSGSNFSPIDPDKIDVKNYPLFAQVPYTYGTLHAGDCVYIPARHIHQVRSYSRTVAVTTLFTGGDTRETFKNDGCETFNNDKYHSMSDVDFHWTYSKGDSTVDMGYMNIEILRFTLSQPIKMFGPMNITGFKKFFLAFSYGEFMIDPGTVFKHLSKGKDVITQKHVDHLSRDDLKFMARAIDPPHGPQSTDGEEVYFLPGDALDNDEIFDEDTKRMARRLKAEYDTEIEQALHEEYKQKNEL